MIACPHGGEVHTIATTRDALTLLTTAWPVAEGKAYVAAIDACEAVITGAATPENARLAFLAAADDAKVVYEFIALGTPSEPVQVLRGE
jgi:hypothetical protein